MRCKYLFFSDRNLTSDDDFLERDYLLPIAGHRIFIIQPGTHY